MPGVTARRQPSGGVAVAATTAVRDAFGELREVILPLARDDDPGILAETFWGGLHGLVTLMRGGVC